MKQREKPRTVERIERRYRVMIAVVWAFRTIAVAFAVMVIVLLMMGLPLWGLIYLVLPPLWWFMTVMWASTARDIRATDYALMRVEEIRRGWTL